MTVRIEDTPAQTPNDTIIARAKHWRQTQKALLVAQTDSKRKAAHHRAKRALAEAIDVAERGRP